MLYSGSGRAPPAVVSGYSLLFHINADLHEIARRDVVDMCVTRTVIFCLHFRACCNFFATEIIPLIGPVCGLFRIKVFHTVAECVEANSTVRNQYESFLAVCEGHRASISPMPVFLRTYIGGNNSFRLLSCTDLLSTLKPWQYSSHPGPCQNKSLYS